MQAMTNGEMRSVLSEQIRKLANGDGDTKVSNSITTACCTIMKSVQLEMNYCRLIGITPKIGFVEGDAPRQIAKSKLAKKKK
jgi:hypothetical protein